MEVIEYFGDKPVEIIATDGSRTKVTFEDGRAIAVGVRIFSDSATVAAIQAIAATRKATVIEYQQASVSDTTV